MNVAVVPASPEAGEHSGPWFSRHLPELGDYLLLHQGPLVDLQDDVHEQLAVLSKPADALVSVLRAGYLAIESAGREPRIEIGGKRPSQRDAAILFCSLVDLSAARTAAVVGGEPEAVASRARELREALESENSLVRGKPVDRSGVRAALAPTMTLAAQRDGAPYLQRGQRVGRWEIVGLHGVGGLGVVYEAREPLGKGPDGKPQFRRAALKVLHDRCLDEASKDGSFAEVRALAACAHPSVVPVIEWGWHGAEDDRLWIAMPFIEGRTLAERMAQGPMSREEAERIFAPLAGAIEHLHQRGIFHDDLKPENVLLARTGDDGGVETPVIIDFGMARRVGQGVRGGTPYWMAPESAKVLVPWAEAIIRAHTAVVETGVESHTTTVAVDHTTGGRSRSSDVFALALMVRDALQPRRASEWSAIKAASETILDALQGRAGEDVPPLDHDLTDVWAVLAPVLRDGQRPGARALGAALVEALRAERERRERRIRALRIVSIGSLALVAVTAGGAYGYREMLAAEEAAFRAQQQAARAELLADERQRQADAARETAALEADARRDADARAAQRARESLEHQRAVDEALRAAEAAGASRQQVQRALQLARSRARELESDLDGLSREIALERSLSARRASDLVRAREEVARASARVAELERSVAEERVQRGRDVSDLNGQLAAARADLDQARTEIGVLSGRIAIFQDQTQHLGRQLQECRTELVDCATTTTPAPQQPAVAPGE